MDELGLCAVSRISRSPRGRWRVQRKVHGEPARSPRRLVPHPSRPRSRQLSQLLAPAHALPDDGREARARGVAMTASARDEVGRSEVGEAVLHGLTRTRKSLPPFLFYDARGSELFEEITELPEYYPTRTERAI